MTDRTSRADINRRVRDAVIRGGERGLLVQEVMDFTTLVYVGEAEVAFEDLCTQLYEHDVVLPLREVEDLEELGRLLGVDPAYARVLRENADHP